MSSEHRKAAAMHAVRRFEERIGVALPFSELSRMARAMAAGQVPAVAFTQTAAPVFHVRYAGVSAYAVYRPSLRTIATFYPSLDWVTARGGRVLRERVQA